ncbi:MAG: AI-2E family transporter [Gammaproteobacteria bacterium]|nr:AI-2E family transporter [Gammaproteobacteria bacterium]
MTNSSVDQKFLANSMASFLRIGALLVLLFWCFTIVSPFVSIFVWGLIISVALYPVHVALSARLGGREKLSATIFVLIGLAVIVVPSWLLAESTIGELQEIAAGLEDGTARIPPPADSVADWPVIGSKVHEIWSSASTNLEATLNQFRPQLRSAGQQALAFAGHTVASAFLFGVSVIIAGVLLTTASGGYAVACNIASRLIGAERGPTFTDLSVTTIRSVAKGVLGIAFIQAILAAVGLLVAGVPAAGLWAGLVLALAIIQLPPLIVLGPIAIWYFSVAEPVPATVFLVYATIVSISDTFLKPLLLGRGIEIPMLVILIGAIGGAITEGIIGLFTGAVILAVGYEILSAWMAPDKAQAERTHG